MARLYVSTNVKLADYDADLCIVMLRAYAAIKREQSLSEGAQPGDYCCALEASKDADSMAEMLERRLSSMVEAVETAAQAYADAA